MRKRLLALFLSAFLLSGCSLTLGTEDLLVPPKPNKPRSTTRSQKRSGPTRSASNIRGGENRCPLSSSMISTATAFRKRSRFMN